MWLIISIGLLGLIVYLFGIKPNKYWKEKGVQTTASWPFLGHLGPFILGRRAIVHIMDDIYRAFPSSRYCGFYNMTTPNLLIRNPELIKIISIKEFDSFPEHRQFIDDEIDPLWGKNLFAIKGGPKWQEMRSILSPFFTSGNMRTMFELMKVCSKQFSEHFAKQDGIVTLEMKDAFTRFTNDVIGTTAFGLTCNSLKDRENEFYMMAEEVSSFTKHVSLVLVLQSVSPILVKFLKLRLFSSTISKFFRRLMIDGTIKLREAHKNVRPDMINLLIKAQKANIIHEEVVGDANCAVVEESEIIKSEKRRKHEITDEDITAQVLIFFFAGFDTVSTMMSYAAYELAINPDIQKRLREEVDEVLKTSEEFTYENLIGMKYLDTVISETLRKWPPFVIADRLCVKAFTIKPEAINEKPLHINKGTICFIPTYSIHRDPEYYPNPDKFNPERFNEENRHKIKPFTYIPFGSGPRNCIASRFALLEGKLIIAEIISKFEIIPVERTQIPIQWTKKDFFPVPNDGLWLGLKPRKK